MNVQNERVAQSRILHNKGLGGDLSFDKYFASSPEIPSTLLKHDSDLPLLYLVDPRLGLTKTCELFGIKLKEFGYDDRDAIAFDARHEISNRPFWVRAHDGRKNDFKKPSLCLHNCKNDILAMTAMVAIMAWVQDSKIIDRNGHVLDCPGSVNRLARGFCAYLEDRHGEVSLHMGRNSELASQGSGSGAFRMK